MLALELLFPVPPRNEWTEMIVVMGQAPGVATADDSRTRVPVHRWPTVTDAAEDRLLVPCRLSRERLLRVSATRAEKADQLDRPSLIFDVFVDEVLTNLGRQLLHGGVPVLGQQVGPVTNELEVADSMR